MPRNVILLILDTARKDYFDEYAPRIQSSSDVSFSQCRAASSCSVPSHGSILTGELPSRHGLHSTSLDYTAVDHANTFLSDLPDHEKIGVSANTFAGSAFGFDTHFDEYADVSWTSRLPTGIDVREYRNKTDASGVRFYTDFLKACLAHERPLRSLANGAFAQFDLLSSKSPFPKLFDDGGRSVLRTAKNAIADAEEPFFTFVNMMDVHTPHHHIRSYDRSMHGVSSSWSSITDFDVWKASIDQADRDAKAVENLRQLYTAALDYVDRLVSEFVTEVRSMTTNETSIVVTSDHGENLGFDAEGGLFGHFYGLSEALLHVPLEIVNPPDGYDATETEMCSQLSLGDLIVGLARGETPDITTETPVAERITVSNVPDWVENPEHWKRPLRCVYEDDRKLVWGADGTATEYELDRDRPSWQRDVSTSDTVPEADERHFEASIGEVDRRMADRNGELDGIDGATEDRLEELGYL